MAQTTISITRALATLKLIDQKISNAINSGRFAGVQVGKNNSAKVLGSNDTVEQFKKTIQGSYDQVDALINNRAALKRAIVLSNANTEVDIQGRIMSVAEAIEFKSTITFRQQYLNTLRSQSLQCRQTVENNNAKLENEIQASLNTIYGSEKGKVDAETYNMISTPQKEKKEQSMIDPADIEKRIAVLTDEVNSLVTIVDFTLSESNSRTTITVDLAGV